MNTEQNSIEARLVAIVGHPDMVKAMDVLVKACKSKDSFADTYATLVAGVDGIRAIITNADNADALVRFCLTYRGVSGKGATRREQNRITYVRTQSMLALCEQLGIEIEDKAAKWEYQRWLDGVRKAIVTHNLSLETVVSDLTEAKAD